MPRIEQNDIDRPASTPDDNARDEALSLIQALREAANGDSNDVEIAAGQNLADFVAALFGISDDEIGENWQ